MAKVFLDAGHGGKDSGACGNNMQEKVINLEVTLQVGAILTQHGVDVNYSRTTDVYLDLQPRCDLANAWDADYLVAIHHNAGGGDGAETYHSVFPDKGSMLSNNIESEFVAIGQNLRNTADTRWNSTHTNDYYGIIRGVKSNISAVLCEFGFIDSADSQIFNTSEKRSVEALAIAKGILKTINIAYQEPKAQQSQPQQSNITADVYKVDTLPCPTNAIANTQFNVCNRDGSVVNGRSVSNGDKIVILNIIVDNQLLEVIYPTSSGYIHGYIKNDDSKISYVWKNQWINGSTSEKTYNISNSGVEIGSIDPRENANVLYKKDGMYAVVYDTKAGVDTKAGLVKYNGGFKKF